MDNEVTEKERNRNAALAFAVDHSRGRYRATEDIVADAEKFYAFLTQQA
jgi:hypothetical protein